MCKVKPNGKSDQNENERHMFAAAFTLHFALTIVQVQKNLVNIRSNLIYLLNYTVTQAKQTTKSARETIENLLPLVKSSS